MRRKGIQIPLVLVALVIVAACVIKTTTSINRTAPIVDIADAKRMEASTTTAEKRAQKADQESPSGSASVSRSIPQQPGNHKLFHRQGSKYPWRLQSERDGIRSTYAAGHVIVTSPLELDPFTAAGYRVERISPTSVKVAWNDVSAAAFDRHVQTLSALFPGCWIEPDYVYTINGWTEGERIHDNDDRSGHKWMYENNYNANGVVIAVLDSGLYADHPELAGAVFTNTLDPVDGRDNDGNGFVDDHVGWDFVNNDRNPDDDEGHGTAMAGLMAADGTNGYGVAGWAPGCRILPVKVLDQQGEGFESDIIRAIDYASGLGIPIINASWGKAGAVSNSLNSAIQRFTNTGGLFVTSAGNDHQDIDLVPYSPASSNLPGIIVVGGLNRDYNGRDGYSNFGLEGMDILAPDSMRVLSLDGDMTGANGTSLASAVVSSMLAVLWKNNPYMGAAAAKEQLLETAIFTDRIYGRCKFPGYPNYQRMLTNTRSPAPRIIGYTLDKDPYHIGEDVSIILDIDADEHYIITGDGWGNSTLDGNVLTVEATAQEKLCQIDVIGLLGSHGIGPVRIKPESSAPYIPASIPSLVNLESLDQPLRLDMLELVRGDRPLSYTWVKAGVNNTVYSNTIILNNSIRLTGLHEFTVSNDAGSYSFSITARWNGMTEASQVMPALDPMRAGSNLVYLSAGVSNVFDGVQTTRHPDINLVGRYSQGVNCAGYLMLPNRPALVTADGVSWNRYDIGSSAGEFVGIYDGALVTDQNSFLYLLKIGQDNYDHITVPGEAIGDYIAGGNVLLSVYNGRIWKYQGDSWTLSRENVPPIASRFYSGGTFILISYTETIQGEDGPREVANVLYSSDGENWSEDVLTFPAGKKLNDLFTYNQQPCLEADGYIVGYNAGTSAWSPLVDLLDKKILIPGLDEALARGSFFIAGGKVFCRPLDGIPHTTAEGVFLCDRNGTFFSRDHLDWTQVSLTGAAVREMNGTTYLLDSTGLYSMNGSVKTRLAEGLQENYPRLSTMHGLLFGYGVTGTDHYSTWYILDPLDMQWKSTLDTNEFIYRNQHFYYEKIGEDQWRSIQVDRIHNNEPTHFRGRSMQYFGGGQWNYRPMEDVVRLPHAVYDFLPNAAYKNIGNWFEDRALGWLTGNEGSPWMWSQDHGWLTSSPDGDGGAYLYSESIGWFHYHQATYPNVYSYAGRAWLGYVKGSRSPRLFYDYASEQWIAVD